MARLFFLYLKLIIVAGLILWFLKNPGHVSIEWLGYKTDMAFGVFILCLSTTLGLLWGGVRALMWVVKLPLQLTRRYEMYHHKKGLHAIYEVLEALNLGNNEKAINLADKIEEWLGEKNLCFALKAQGLLQQKKYDDAMQIFEELSRTPEGVFYGTYGQFRVAQAQGLQDRAYLLAQTLFRKKTTNEHVAQCIYDNALVKGDLESAFDAIQILLKNNAISPSQASEMKTHVFLISIKTLQEKGALNDAYETAKRAFSFQESPEILKLYLPLLLKEGHPRRARSYIKEILSVSFDESLFESLMTLEEIQDPVSQFQRLQELLKNPEQTCEQGLKALIKRALKADMRAQAHNLLEIYETRFGINQTALYLSGELATLEGADTKKIIQFYKNACITTAS